MTKRTERAQRTQAKNGAGAAPAHLVEPMLAGMTTTRQHLLAWVHAHGLAALDELFREEAVALAGPKGRHQAQRTHHHWGTAATELTFGGRRVQVRRPRVRPTSGGEATLPSVAAFRDRDPLTARMMQQLLVGVSMRDYDGSLEARPSGRRTRGSSKSAVSRTVVRRTRQRLHEHLARRLDGLEVVALFMDGIVVAQQTVIVVLAITRDGGKVPLGLRLGSTENAVVCTELLQDLQGAAQSARRCPRRRRADPTLPAAQGPQPRRPRAEDAARLRPGEPASSVSGGQRAGRAPPADGARDVAGDQWPCRCRGECARRPGGNAHRAEAGAATGAAPFLRDDELHREFDRHAAACHAEHQALARWRHATAVDRARLVARRRALPTHQAPWRTGRARDRARHRHGLGARRVSPRGQRRRKCEATIGSGSIFSPGGAAMSASPCCHARRV